MATLNVLCINYVVFSVCGNIFGNNVLLTIEQYLIFNSFCDIIINHCLDLIFYFMFELFIKLQLQEVELVYVRWWAF